MFHSRTLACLALVFLILFSMSFALGETEISMAQGKLTDAPIFHAMFLLRVTESEEGVLSDTYVFPPIYSDGHWVRTYTFGGAESMRVLTSAEGGGAVCRIDILSAGEDNERYRELCAYVLSSLTLKDLVKRDALISGDVDLQTFLAENNVQGSGYAYEVVEDTAIPYVTLSALYPYEVEGAFEISKNASVNYPLRDDALTVEVFLSRLSDVLTNHYGLSADELTHRSTSQSEGDWLHIYSYSTVAIVVAAEGESENSIVREVTVMDMEGGDPTLLAGLGVASFGAVVDFEPEQSVAMSLLPGPNRTFDALLRLLPVVAYNDAMLLFGTSGEYGAAYIMGTPSD